MVKFFKTTIGIYILDCNGLILSNFYPILAYLKDW